MASDMTKAVYELLSEDRPVTAAGAAYLLRNDFTPIPVMEETERSLDWLKRRGLAVCNEYGPFGPEYLRKPRPDTAT